ncbi:hypothetical protein [Novipirellula herctigrandis]|uniref:hypothetical protein n=1 Tax=Novipirellula herctigrandis TaxID=2527986 RepID=UPI003AF3E364
MARIVVVFPHDQRAILTICSRIQNMDGVADVTISMSHLLGGDGVILRMMNRWH